MRSDSDQHKESPTAAPDQPRAERARRAEVHRALSDPLRIAIIDELFYSDLAPSELETRLRVTSNLLAHHVDALEAVGLVTRTQSQGDRRRKYLSLTEAGQPF
ncbi:MAG: MarR family transcriptional regulator, partial [Dehalococcoidia bacterium]